MWPGAVLAYATCATASPVPDLSPRTLGPCTPSPTTTFGDLRNAKVGQARRRRIPSVAPPPELQDWLRTFQVQLTWWLQAAWV